MARGQLSADSQSLELHTSLRSALAAITVLSGISLASSTLLFAYLACKLAAWNLAVRRRDEHGRATTTTTTTTHTPPARGTTAREYALGLDMSSSSHNRSDSKNRDGDDEDPKASKATTQQQQQQVEEEDGAVRQRRSPPNQFIVLIVCLLLADMHQGLAFFLNFLWLKEDLIHVGTPQCFVQGLFVSTGDLSSSTFITLIAVHTYLTVVRGKKISENVLYAVIACAWAFVYLITLIPIGATHNGAAVGGFYVRAGAWCWMNEGYENIRLLTHYLYIFMALFSTTVLYVTIFLSLRRQVRSAGATTRGDTSNVNVHLNHNPAFLLYPIIYVSCTMPLALGRIATMAGGNVPLEYFGFAGALISCNGMFDCLLFGITRRVLIFGSKDDIDREDIGLNTFAFMKTPTGRHFGNFIWVQGGRHRIEEEETPPSWPWHGLTRSDTKRRTRTTSQESLRGPAIHMDTVTTVVVELDPDKDNMQYYQNSSADTSGSVNSIDKGYRSRGM